MAKRTYFTPDDRPKKKPNVRLLLCTVAVVAAVLGFYIAAVSLAVFGRLASQVFYWLYYAALLGLILAYICCNRGFVFRTPAREELPLDWTEERKSAFLEKVTARKKRTRFLLVGVLALLVTFIYDMIGLFFGDAIAALFASLGGQA